MQRVQKYNQWVLAVVGTIVLLFLSFALFKEASDWFGNRAVKDDNSAGTTEILNNIAYLPPVLVDSFTNVFIIPVTTDDQEYYVFRNEEENEESTKPLSGPLSWEAQIIYENYESLQNLVDYRPDSNVTQPIFNEPVTITYTQAVMIGIDYYLLMNVSSNKTTTDSSSAVKNAFYTYSFENRKLNKVQVKNAYLESFELRYNSREVLLTFMQDESNKPTESKTFIISYNLAENTKKMVTDSSLTTQLKAILEGK